jgi:protein-S-isoprenylcysteine O-methyltransferase Ste14
MRLVHWILFIAAIVTTGSVLYFSQSQGIAWPISRVSGVCLLLLAFAWIAVARFQLGRAFSVTAQARQLVTTGLYKRIRNPIYFASPFVLVGIALVIGKLWPLLLLVGVIPLQVSRARREEAVLRAAFGAEYDDYRRRTWF